jgi:hypothetical protein
MTAPPVGPPDVPPPITPPVMPTEVQSALTLWVNTVISTAVTNAITQLLSAESTLMLPLTAWANGWMEQVRTDYSPGGVLAQSLAAAVHNFHVFLPNEGELAGDPENVKKGWSPLPFEEKKVGVGDDLPDKPPPA